MDQKNRHTTPTVEVKVETFTVHGTTIQDPYKWLRDKNWPDISNPEILSYVQDENTHSKEFFDNKSELIEKIFQEIKSKILLKDFSVPYKDGDYMYYSYILEGEQYWNHARRRIIGDDNEIVIKISQEIEQEKVTQDIFINENSLAKDSKFFALHTYTVSPSQDIVAYSVDYKGDKRYDIVVQEIDTGRIIDLKVTNIMGDIVWDQNGKGFFYIPANEFWRSEKVLYHTIGSTESDIEIYHEKDYTFSVDIEKSSSKDFLFISSNSYTAKEVKFLDLRNNDIKSADTKFLFQRKPGHIFSVTHNKDHFYILTNDLGDNFRLIKIRVDDLSQSEEIISHNESVPLTGIDMYQDHFVLTTRVNGLPMLSVYAINSEDGILKFNENIKFSDPSYDVRVLFTAFNSGAFRYKYSSLKNPGMVYEYNFTAGETTKLKEVKLNGFNPDDYEIKYEYVSVPPVYHNEDVSSKDNIYLKNDVKVPVTIIYKKSNQNPKPLLLYGYGSYGIPMPTVFRPSIFPLLDRGFAFAIAHIRGGGELGKMWYEAGKMLHKKNTFEDFIKVAEYLKNTGYASAIAISGGSAGGMLIGYCINNRPDLYEAAIAKVPFVDVLNTMLDDTLPLTPLEFNEWGNPIVDKKTFDYMKSYSPYDNIKPQEYPHLFISSGLYDQQVTYWEPLKFVAKLRQFMKDKNLLLKMNMNAGHSGASGRFDYIFEIAEEDAFLLSAFDKYK